MIPKGEDVKIQLSLADRNFLHERFCMEAFQNFIFSLFKYVDASYWEGKGIGASYE